MQDSVIYRSIQEEAETRAKARKQREIALHCIVVFNPPSARQFVLRRIPE